jgi:hypothetical protein
MDPRQGPLYQVDPKTKHVPYNEREDQGNNKRYRFVEVCVGGDLCNILRIAERKTYLKEQPRHKRDQWADYAWA